jgi:hypothetical protein
MYLGPSDRNDMLGDKHHLRYIVLHFISSNMLPILNLCVIFLSIIITTAKEEKGQENP